MSIYLSNAAVGPTGVEPEEFIDFPSGHEPYPVLGSQIVESDADSALQTV